MSDSPYFYGTLAKRAEEKLLGTKFCFACQKQRPLATGKNFIRGKNKMWKCHMCVAKLTPVGFGKGSE